MYENDPDLTNRFHFDELKSLRADLEQRASEIGRVALYSLGGVALIYAWLAKAADPNHPGTLFLGLFGALLLTIGTTARTWLLESRVIELGNYIQSLEEKFGVVGFESHRRTDPNSKLPWTLSPWSSAFTQLVVLTFFTLAVLIYFLAYSLSGF